MHKNNQIQDIEFLKIYRKRSSVMKDVCIIAEVLNTQVQPLFKFGTI